MTLARTIILGGLLACQLGTECVASFETWPNLDGQNIKAEFVGRNHAYVTFRKEDGSKYLYPLEKLSDADRARIDALVAADPSLVRKLSAATVTPAPRPAPAPPATASTASGRLISVLDGKLVTYQGSGLYRVPSGKLASTRYLAIYYSAHWCPPCRRFTPQLVEAYKEIKATHPEFELIFVSNDRDENEMRNYMQQAAMPWLALSYEHVRSIRELARPAKEGGIPNLVFVDADGKELSLSYDESGDYRGPQAVLADIKKHFNL